MMKPHNLLLILDMIQIVTQHCNCLNLIDLPLGREAYTAKWKLASRAPVMYEPYPRKRETKTYLSKYMLRNDRAGHNLYLKASRRTDENEMIINLKNKIKLLIEHAMHDIEEKMKELDSMTKPLKEKQAYKAGFLLNMIKRSREVINELFNVAIKHRDEWQALEQLKIFEMIVNTNIENNHYVKQLQDVQTGVSVPKTTSTSAPRNETTSPNANVTLPDTTFSTVD